MSAVGEANRLFGNLVRLALVGLLGTGGFLGWKVWSDGADHVRREAEKDQAIAQLTGENGERKSTVATQQKEIERLALALKLSKIDKRVARIVVLDQTAASGASHGATRLRFEEVDREGRPIAPAIEATIEGDLVYVDAWVVKFEDVYVEKGDPLRGASIVLFQRLFGEHQAPVDGVALDRRGVRPAIYGGDAALTDFERTIWSDFWGIAGDPARARQFGVRVAHGEAPSNRVKKGEVYALTVRASGGIDFTLDRPEPRRE